MKIRISLPEDRDYAGRLEVLDASGAVVLGPLVAAGRAHDQPAAAHGNALRNPLLPYGDTPLGGYVVVGVVGSGQGTGLDGKVFGGQGVVQLEPISGAAAVADAQGRFRLFIQGGGEDEAGLRATTGAIRLQECDQKELVALLRRVSGRVICEVVTTGELGAKVVVTQPPPDCDPPALPDLPDSATYNAKYNMDRATPVRANLGARTFHAEAGGGRAGKRLFVVPEHSGSGGGTGYGGGGGDAGDGDGSIVTADTGTDTIPAVVGQPVVTDSDSAPSPGADMTTSSQEPLVIENASGASQLLSTAAQTGFSDQYGTSQGGWSASQPTAPPSSLASYVGTDVETYSGEQSYGGNQNYYTGTSNVETYSGLPQIASNGPIPDGTEDSTQASPADLQRLLNAGGAISDPTQVSVSQTYGSQGAETDGGPPSDHWVDPITLAGLTPIGSTEFGGVDYAHFQVTIDGVTYNAYVNDVAYPDQAFLVPAATQSSSTSATAPADATSAVTPLTNSTQTPDPQGWSTVPTTSISTTLDPTNGWQLASPNDPLSPFVSAIPGGLGTGAQFAPQPNWTYRALVGDGPRGPADPTLTEIAGGANLTPVQPQDGAPFQPEANPADMSFRHTRGDSAVLSKGTDRISTAQNLEPFQSSGPGGLQDRGTGELARIDVDLAERLGAEYRDTAQLLEDLTSVEQSLAQQLEAAQAAGRGQNFIRGLENKLAQVQRAQEYIQNYQEGQFVNEVPSRAVSEVSGSQFGDPAAVADAAAREAAFLRGLEYFRGVGDALLVVGVVMSVDRIATAPEDQVGRVVTEEAGGWAVSLALAAEGAETGAEIGAAFGIETGPGAIITGIVGGLIGGIVGFVAGQQLGDAAYDTGESLLSDDGDPYDQSDPYLDVTDF